MDEAIRVSDAELSVLGVLMLRGPQTPGELKLRSERLHPFASIDEIERILAGLAGRELVERLSRRPGQKEMRYRQLLGGEAAADDPLAQDPGHDRIEELEERVAKLEEELAAVQLSLRNASFEGGGERLAHRPKLDSVENVLEEPPDD